MLDSWILGTVFRLDFTGMATFLTSSPLTGDNFCIIFQSYT